MAQRTYSLSAVENLINRYSQIEGNTYSVIEEGVLGYGKIILKAPNKKTTVITEVYQNEWSSVHKVRMYNVCPKKYDNY